MTKSLRPKKKNSESIGSIQNLAEALGLEVPELEEASDSLKQNRYKRLEVPKSNGSLRSVYDPSPTLRKVQARINARIFIDLIEWPDYLFGSIPNTNLPVPFSRDYIACAKLHCRAKSILKVDIEDFFENVHRDFVMDIFEHFFKYPKTVSTLLTDICCHNHKLVQGSLTSSYLATLSLWDIEGNLVAQLRRKNLVYTRLVDDITVSSKLSAVNFDDVVYQIREMLLKKGLPLNTRKTETQYAGIVPLQVHGLRVDFDSPRLPSKEVRNIRAAVNNVVTISRVNNYRTSRTYRHQFDRCMGRVNRLARVGHNKHAVLKAKLLEVLPLPSKCDISRAERLLKRLEATPVEKRSTRPYRRHFHLCRYRVGIIKRTFKREAEGLLARLKKIRPVAK